MAQAARFEGLWQPAGAAGMGASVALTSVPVTLENDVIFDGLVGKDGLVRVV